MTDKEKLDAIRAEIHRLVDVRGYDREMANDLLTFIDSLPNEPKECMFTKDYYTDKDRKVLCDGCGEECRFNKKEVPVSEEQVKESLISKHEDKTCKENGNSLTQEPISDDLEEAIDTYLKSYFGGEKEKQDWPFLKKMAIHFAEWQKQQLMVKAIDATVHIDAGGYPYIPQMEIYDYEKDIPLAKEGDKVKVLVIKQE